MANKPPLVDFTCVLLNHAANDSRTSREEAQKHLDGLRDHYENMKNTDIYLTEEYNRVHELPRIERETKTADYASAKGEKWKEYKESHRSQTVLNEYVSLTSPMEANAKISQQIYTKYL